MKKRADLWLPPLISIVGTILLGGGGIYFTLIQDFHATKADMKETKALAVDTNARVRVLECNSSAQMEVVARHIGRDAAYRQLLDEKEKYLKLRESELRTKGQSLAERENAVNIKEKQVARDELSIMLSRRSAPVLVDPGTFEDVKILPGPPLTGPEWKDVTKEKAP